MTRGQKFQWHLERGIAEGMLRLPDSCDARSVRKLVGSLQRQCEILRTTVEVVDGDLRQRVHGSGEPVVVVDVAPESDAAVLASVLAEQFTADTVRQVGKFLAKFYLLRQGAERWLAVIADSTAIDRAFYQMLERAMREHLGRAGEPAHDNGSGLTGLQPIQVALREGSPHGRAERQQAREYLRQHLSTAPPILHPRHGGSEARVGRYYRATATLPCADKIFAQVIEATGRLPSAAVLGVFASLMCWRADVAACAVNVSMENRHTRELRMALCATAQRAPVGVRMSGGTLGDGVAAAEAALSAAYPVAGRYEPSDLVAERTSAEARRGLCLTPDLAFNFSPPLQGWTTLLESALSGSAAHGAAAPSIDIRTTNETWYEYAASLSMRWSDAHTARLSIHADSQAVARGDCATVLGGIEAGLAELARGRDGVGVAEIAESVRLDKVERHPREVRDNGVWYDLAAVEECLLEVDGVEQVKLRLDGGRGGGLSARAAIADAATVAPSDLRMALLERVRAGAPAAIPTCFEVVRSSTGELR